MVELTLLGTKGGPSLRKVGPSFLPSSSHISFNNYSVIVDCGLGVSAAMVRAGHALTNLTHIFISHYHSDHCLELGNLIHTAWTSGLSKPIKVFGPPGLENIWENFLKMMKFDIDVRIKDEGRPPLHDLVSIQVYDPEGDQVFSIFNEREFFASGLRNSHPPINDSFSLRFDLGNKSITFSGDTAYFPNLAKLAKGSDILVHEAMLERGVNYIVEKTKNADERLEQHLKLSHTLAAEAGDIAMDAGVSHLLLNHLIPPEREICNDDEWLSEVRKTFDGSCSVGFDGMRVFLQ